MRDFYVPFLQLKEHHTLVRPVLKQKIVCDASIWRQEIESCKKLLPALQPRVINLSVWLQPKKPIKVGQFVCRRKGWSLLQDQAHNGLTDIQDEIFPCAKTRVVNSMVYPSNNCFKVTSLCLASTLSWRYILNIGFPLCIENLRQGVNTKLLMRLARALKGG